MDAISFKARFINNVTVSKLNSATGKYEEKVVSLVEMNKNSASDFASLFKLCSLWKYSDNFIGTILMTLSNFDRNTRNVYILTEQKDNFWKLIPEQILGVEEVQKQNNSYRLDYLQTRPDTKFKAKGREYKGIGSSLLNHILNKFGTKKKIYLNSDENAMEFYKKYGFKVLDRTLADPLMAHFPIQ